MGANASFALCYFMYWVGRSSLSFDINILKLSIHVHLESFHQFSAAVFKISRVKIGKTKPGIRLERG